MKKRFSIRLVLPCAGGLLLLTPSMACAATSATSQRNKANTLTATDEDQEKLDPSQAPKVHPMSVQTPSTADLQAPKPHAFLAAAQPLQALLPGEHRTDIQGCLVQKNRATEDSATPRSAAQNPPEKPEQQVLVQTLPGQLVLTHQLRHGCCLQAEVLRQINNNSVVVDVVLSGKTCRCLCQSQLKSTFGLAPGDYQVTVQVHESQHKKMVVDQQVSIPARPRLQKPAQKSPALPSQALRLSPNRAHNAAPTDSD